MSRDLRHILCPSDFSSSAQRALDLAVVMARRLSARITSLHVASGRARVAAGRTASPLPLAALQRRRLGARLERFAEPARLAGVPTETEVHEGAAVPGILQRADSLCADLIVMGTAARQASSWRLGSVVGHVVGRASCPVLAVPQQLPSTPARGDIQRILCPMDFSEPGGVSLEYARALARAFGARLVLLHVLEYFPEGAPGSAGLCIGEYQLDLAAEARRRMNDAALVEPCEHEELVAGGQPHRQILRLARERDVDMIVLGVHGRRGIDRVLPGGTLCHVVRGAPCPVLVVGSPPAVGRGRPAADPRQVEGGIEDAWL